MRFAISLHFCAEYPCQRPAGGSHAPHRHPRYGHPELDGACHRRDRDRLPPVAADRRSRIPGARPRPGGGRAQPYGHPGHGQHGLPVPAAGAGGGGVWSPHPGGQRDHGRSAAHTRAAHRVAGGAGRGQPNGVELDGARGSGHAAPHGLPHGTGGRCPAPGVDGGAGGYRHPGPHLDGQWVDGGYHLPLPGVGPQCRRGGSTLRGHLRAEPAAAGAAGGGDLSPDRAPVAGRHCASLPYLGDA